MAPLGEPTPPAAPLLDDSVLKRAVVAVALFALLYPLADSLLGEHGRRAADAVDRARGRRPNPARAHRS